jgi:hypothetical protein
MTNKEHREYARVVGILQGESGLSFEQTADLVEELHRCEKQLNTLYTNMCNRELTERETGRIENIKDNVNDIVKHMKLKDVEFNQDPRGCAIKLKLESGRYNSWDGESLVLDW